MMIRLQRSKLIAYNERRKWKCMVGLLAHAGMILSDKYKERQRLSKHALVLFYKGTLIRVPQEIDDTPEMIAIRAMHKFTIECVAQTEILKDISVVSFCRNPGANSVYSFVRFFGDKNIYNVTMNKTPDEDTTDLSVLFATQQRKKDFYCMVPFFVSTFDGKLFTNPDLYKKMH